MIGGTALRSDGRALPSATRYSFTTQTAPTVTDFQVRLADADLPQAGLDANAKLMAADVLDADALSGKAIDALPPTATAKAVSATSTITVSFSEQMDPADVRANFAITPEVPGELALGSRPARLPTVGATPSWHALHDQRDRLA